jgi:hypothetical protein
VPPEARGMATAFMYRIMYSAKGGLSRGPIFRMPGLGMPRP